MRLLRTRSAASTTRNVRSEEEGVGGRRRRRRRRGQGVWNFGKEGGEEDEN
jgi:hypothetical protein